MNVIVELFGYYTKNRKLNWKKIVSEQVCRYTGKKSNKVRKSQPGVAIGTVVVKYGREGRNLIIDPTRFLENGQVFADCLHLLTSHEPGSELHLIPEVRIPGGNVDYFLASVKGGRVRDFVGIELQSLDTTGSLWAERQRLLVDLGVIARARVKAGNFGINWKMTAKTTLVQLHHKVATFEHLGKKLVLVIQDDLLNYMSREFNFDHWSEPALLGEPMHLHAYGLHDGAVGTRLELRTRMSTDGVGLARSLGLKAEAQVELDYIINRLQQRISIKTRFSPIRSHS